MKIPTIAEPLALARMYASASLNFTYSYGGWEDQDKQDAQYKRIITGQLGQNFLASFCHLNNIPFKVDNSHYSKSDDFDIVIKGYKFDVKTSNTNLPCQVNAALENKNIDAFYFFNTDKNYTYIEPLGFISKKKYLEKAKFVSEGEKIPNTNFIQRFKKGSYFLDASELSEKGLLPLINIETKKVEVV